MRVVGRLLHLTYTGTWSLACQALEDTGAAGGETGHSSSFSFPMQGRYGYASPGPGDSGCDCDVWGGGTGGAHNRRGGRDAGAGIRARLEGPQVEGAGGTAFREALDRWAERSERARMLLGSGWLV